MRQDRGNGDDRSKLQPNERNRPSHEDYSQEDRRPMLDDVTDTLAAPTRPPRRDTDGGNNTR